VGEVWVIDSGSIPATATDYTVTGLSELTEYEVSTRATNSVSNGPWSPQTKGVTTTANPPEPVPPPTPQPGGGEAIWWDRFDTAADGRLTKVTGDLVFGPSVTVTDSGTYSKGEIVTTPAGKALRHHIPMNDLGALILAPKLSRETDHAALQYSVFFDPNFDWQWGGKLACGLVGVRPGHGIFEPTSGNTDRDIGFSTRLMWHGNNTNGTGTGRPFSTKLPAIPAGSNDLVTYIYARYPKDGFSGFGWHTSLGPISKGAWHTIKMETKLNTVGKADGVFRVWIDGAVKYEATDWDYRNSGDVHIQAVLWDIHRGGGLPTWGSPQDCFIDIRDVTVTDLG
jgi:hypothetical protein